MSTTDYLPAIASAADRYAIDRALLAGLVEFESGGNPTIRSPAGAVGLGQIMPRETGFPGRPTASELEDPATNLDWAGRILRAGIDRWGTIEQGLAAYLGTINGRGEIIGDDPYTGVSGHEYVQRVLAAAETFRGAFGDVTPPAPPSVLPTLAAAAPYLVAALVAAAALLLLATRRPASSAD